MDHALINALFTVTDGKVGIRAERKSRCGIVFEVVLNVAHTGFFVCAEERTDSIAKGNILFFKVFERIKTNHAGSFIVHNAASDDIAIFFPHFKGAFCPAFADGNNIEMGYRGNIFFAVLAGELRIAYIVFAVSGAEPKLARDFKSQFKGFFRLSAKRGAFLRFALNARNGNKAADIPEDIFFVFFDKKVYVFKVYIHNFSPFRIPIVQVYPILCEGQDFLR